MSSSKSLQFAVSVLVVLVLGVFSWSVASNWRVHALRDQLSSAQRAGRWDDAVEILDRLAWYEPADREVLRMRVQAMMRAGDRLAAARLMATVPDDDPEASAVQVMRGRLLMDLFRAREAEAAFRDALRLDPNNVEARRGLVALYGIRRQAREQEQELLAMLEPEGSPLEALGLLAAGSPVIPPDVLVRTADEGQVLASFVENDGEDRVSTAALAYFHRNRGELPRALGVLDPLLLPRGLDAVRLEWIACRLDEGDIEGVRPWLEAPPEPPPSGSLAARFHDLRGQWLGLQGLDTDAAEEFAKAVEAAPRDTNVRYRLAQALRAAGREEEADAQLARLDQVQRLREITQQIGPATRNVALFDQAAALCRSLGREPEATAWQSLRERIAQDDQPEAPPE